MITKTVYKVGVFMLTVVWLLSFVGILIGVVEINWNLLWIPPALLLLITMMRNGNSN